MSETSQRLLSKINASGFSYGDLSKITGIPKSALQRYATGETEKIPLPRVESLASALGTTAQYILGWDVKSSAAVAFMPVGEMYRIPIIGSVRCGFGHAAIEELIGYDFANVKNPEEYKFFQAKGDSMTPKIEDGDLALVHVQPDVESGELAVVVINGDEGMLKKVIKQGESVILQSFNSNYPPKIFSGSERDTLCIYGKVVKTEKRW